MNPKKELLKKNLPLFIAAFGVILLLTISLFISAINLNSSRNKAQNINSSPTLVPERAPYTAVSLNPNEIKIGQTEQDVKDTIGTPTNISSENGYTVYSYQIQDTARDDKIYFQNNNIKYISKEITYDNTLYTDFTTQNKKTEDGVLYDKIQDGAGFQWYVFAEDGVAYLTNKQFGYVIQTKYFPPTDYQTFLNTSAKDLNMLTTQPQETDTERYQ